MGKYITDYFLYRRRFILGYGIISLAIIGLLLIVGLYIPGGLSEMEMRAVVTSNALTLSLENFNPESIINLPFHLLQQTSFNLFGVSIIAIKLPSLVLGLASAVGMLLLLQTWFRRNVATITTILVITTGQFLFIAQNGTPSILYVFWSIWLLVAAMMISRRASWGAFWKIMLFAIAALSLYTPLSLYVLLALASAVLLHPHLRYVVRHLSKKRIAIGFMCGIILATPLIYALILQPSLVWTLLGIPAQWPDLAANGVQLLRQYFDFVSPSSSILMTPIYGLGSMLLIILGVYRLVTTKYTARSYIISIWIILLLPILIINPAYVSVTFVPVVLLMGMGISVLLGNWYRLFPQNPYARIAGLIPLAVLIGGMVFSGVDRYIYGYHYDPQTAGKFSKDLQILNEQLAINERGKTTIVAASSEKAFYRVIADHNNDVTVSSAPTPSATTTIVTRAAKHASANFTEPDQIITDGVRADADRFYIYKTDVK